MALINFGMTSIQDLMSIEDQKKLLITTEKNQPKVVFFGVEDQVKIQAVLDTSQSPTPLAALLINIALFTCSSDKTFEPIQFIRSNNLEQYFSFSVIA
jgi:hypothetical protein